MELILDSPFLVKESNRPESYNILLHFVPLTPSSSARNVPLFSCSKPFPWIFIKSILYRLIEKLLNEWFDHLSHFPFSPRGAWWPTRRRRSMETSRRRWRSRSCSVLEQSSFLLAERRPLYPQRNIVGRHFLSPHNGSSCVTDSRSSRKWHVRPRCPPRPRQGVSTEPTSTLSRVHTKTI